MPELLQSCETVDEAERLRDSIEMHRLDNMTELILMRKKQQLFRKYCELKHKFVTLIAGDSDDLKVQKLILDETWAEWIQDYERLRSGSNIDGLVQELQHVIESCSKRAKQFESDNIYHIMEFGAIRQMKGDFEGATKFYDQVIRMNPDWSAFAHYNRAYCTIQRKGHDYIRRAIDDLNATLCKLEIYKQNFMFSEINFDAHDYDYAAAAAAAAHDDDDDDEDDAAAAAAAAADDDSGNLSNWRSTQFYIMMECQMFHHIDTTIIETIEKLEEINTMRGEVTTVRRQNIADLIPGADCRIVQMLHEYRQLGLLFTYNINVEPQFSYRNQIVSSLVTLKSVADSILMAFMNGILVNSHNIELKINDMCNIGAIGGESLRWMSQCVSRAIITGIHSIDFMRDFSSLVPITENELELWFEMAAETSLFKEFANSQVKNILNLLASTEHVMSSCQWDEISLHVTNVALDISRKQFEKTIQNNIKSGQNLHRQLSCLYTALSPSRSDFQQYVDCIRELAQISAHSSQLSDTDFRTARIQNNVKTKKCKDNITSTDLVESRISEITTAAAEIEIGNVITKFSDFLCGMINKLNQKTKANGNVCGDVKMFEETNKVLTSEWSEIIQGRIQNRIRRSVMLDIQTRTEELFASINHTLTAVIDTDQSKLVPYLASRSEKYIIQMKKSRGPHDRLRIEARVISKCKERNIIILDVDKEAILTISSPDIRESIELIYNPPCHSYPGGHFDKYIDGKVVQTPSGILPDRDDDDRLYYSAMELYGLGDTGGTLKVLQPYINEHPSEGGMLISSVNYAGQLKRGRAILRFDTNPPTRQMNLCEYVELDSSHLFSSIEQAMKSENVSRLTKALAEYESESIYADVNASEHGTEMMTSSMSRDAQTFFQSSGNSVEADIYRQLIVERINDDDITTALKLCCIGHQIPFCEDNKKYNRPISDAQTLRDTFDQMLKIESYEQERSTFLSICDEWCRVLESQGLMNIEQRELLMEWISTRQYANTEDPVVSLVIKKCLEPKKKEEERKWQDVDEFGKTIWKMMKKTKITRKHDDDDDDDYTDDDDDDDDNDDDNNEF